ncbi:MAG: UDP-N-acetylglucosamine 4,6-dehydratase (inverting) [Candidatus Cyclobacteriaceae bacterium M3_2C_046]
MLNLNNKNVLITGGTGSFGKKFVSTILEKYPNINRLVVFSRDELKQFEMSQEFPKSKYPGIRYFIGDVRDKDRLYRAFEGIDIVVHAAALKQVPAAEYNPFEFIKTNIIGAENIINAALDKDVSNIVALSTDKAAAPINLYGATKLCSDKLFVAANNMKGKRECKFSIVRYGNVMGSRGSVIPFFLNKKQEGVLPITHKEMTRFNILLEEGVNLVLYALENALGGEIFVPKIPSYKILDMARAVAPDCEIRMVGVRPGEKIHEEMITSSDSYNTLDLQDYFVILPQTQIWKKDKYIEELKARPVPEGFQYNSGENDQWLSVNQIRELIKKHLYPDFQL